ncbi:MAG TPA: PQQ-binding-like beta-propeller repeat protein [Phycisphaerae bacterium]|nr:PQQ-binding-like beta-propeller repeat protein [Phycisphaerae bacterium]
MAAAAALVAGAFSLVVGALLVWNLTLQRPDPQDDARMKSLKDELVRQSNSEQIRQKIRARDIELRSEFFRRRELARRGGYLLVGGLIVLLLSAGAAVWRPVRPARPGPVNDEPDVRQLLAKQARWSVAAVVLALVGGALGWAAVFVGGMDPGVPQLAARAPDAPTTAPRPTTSTAPRPTTVRVARSVAVDEIRKQWGRFRGPFGAGVYDGQAPTDWDGNSDRNVLWKTPIPLPGNNSPVVWAGRVFVTGADANRREVYCLDAEKGGLLWRRAVRTPNAPVDLEVMKDTGYAAPTAAADGRRVCAVFANGDIACFDPNGGPLWSRNLRLKENAYGYASSLDLIGDLLIVQLDELGPDDNASRVVALDPNTGEEVWSAPRPTGASWTSPIVVKVGERFCVIACGNPYVIAHDLADGEDIWRAEVIGADAAPSPIYAGRLVFAINSGAELSAVRPGTGDVTRTGIVWKADEYVPDIVSPVSDGNLLWTLTTDGMLVCYDAAAGSRLWTKELDAGFQASPSLAGGRLYLLAESGLMIIAQPGPAYSEIARCPLGEEVLASPAFWNGRIYIRGRKHLYCIGATKQ